MKRVKRVSFASFMFVTRKERGEGRGIARELTFMVRA